MWNTTVYWLWRLLYIHHILNSTQRCMLTWRISREIFILCGLPACAAYQAGAARLLSLSIRSLREWISNSYDIIILNRLEVDSADTIYTLVMGEAVPYKRMQNTHWHTHAHTGTPVAKLTVAHASIRLLLAKKENGHVLSNWQEKAKEKRFSKVVRNGHQEKSRQMPPPPAPIPGQQTNSYPVKAPNNAHPE